MEFVTYRPTRLIISLLIFGLTFFCVELIRRLDQSTIRTLEQINRTLGGFYPATNLEKAEQLLVVDLDLALDDTIAIKRACARLIDSLMSFGARGVVVDIAFDPYLAAAGREELLDCARRYSNIVFAFEFVHETQPDVGAVMKSMGGHAISYSKAKKEIIKKWPDRNLNQIAPPLAGLAELANRMGYIEIFYDDDGQIRYYPLFLKLSGVDSIFAGLSTQAFRLWMETDKQYHAGDRWHLDDYFGYLNNAGVELDEVKALGRCRVQHHPDLSIRPDFTWKNFQKNEVQPKDVAQKIVLVINNRTEKTIPSQENDPPLWSYHAAIISQLIAPGFEQSSDMEVWFLLLALYAGWVYVRLWPSKLNHRIYQRRTLVWVSVLVLLCLLPLALPGPNLIRNAPVSMMFWISLAVLTFEIVERLILRLPRINFSELHLVLETSESGAAQINIQRAPVRLGKQAIYALPADKAEFWRQYQPPPYIKEPLEMRVLGESLYDFLISGEVGKVFESSLEKAVSERKILRLRLRHEGAGFDSLPFEMLRNSEKDYGYLGLHSHLSIARDRTADPGPELQWTLPLRLLLLMASPVGHGYAPLNVQAEKNKIIKSTRLLQRKGWLRLHIIERATSARLENLPEKSFDIFHFVGHGIIDQATRSNCLVFEGEGGEPDPIDAERLGQLMRQIAPRLVILNACATGEGAEKGFFINIGRELQRTTGAAVIAQQYSISDPGGVALSDAFYKIFAETLSPEYALTRARQIISATGDTLPSDWVSPVYFVQ